MNDHDPSMQLSSHNPSGQCSFAVVFQQPKQLEVSEITLPEPASDEVVVDIDWSGISTGTELLLWNGNMPMFPGMGYPLVPGYESVGRVARPSESGSLREGDMVFVPGASCYGEIRGLFGGTASRLIVPESRALKIQPQLAEKGTLLALAATAYHALKPTPDAALPELIIGHGVLGRLLARLVIALDGQPPVVWETQERRRDGANGYSIIDPEEDSRTDYHTILDASGDSGLLDTLISRLAKGGEIILAGFYAQPLQFAFPPAFMREARMRIAAEWQPQDFDAVRSLCESGRLSLDGLITHELPAKQAANAYHQAFEDSDCLKMILNWKGMSSC